MWVATMKSVVALGFLSFAPQLPWWPLLTKVCKMCLHDGIFCFVVVLHFEVSNMRFFSGWFCLKKLILV